MAEHKRSSLVDDSFESVGAAKKAKSSSGGGSGKTIKVAVALVILAIAGIVMAVNFGIIPNPFEEKVKPTIRSEEDNKATQDYQKQLETNKAKPNVNQGGS